MTLGVHKGTCSAISNSEIIGSLGKMATLPATLIKKLLGVFSITAQLPEIFPDVKQVANETGFYSRELSTVKIG